MATFNLLQSTIMISPFKQATNLGSILFIIAMISLAFSIGLRAPIIFSIQVIFIGILWVIQVMPDVFYILLAVFQVSLSVYVLYRMKSLVLFF